MWSELKSRLPFGKLEPEVLPAVLVAAVDGALADISPEEESKMFETIGWVSAAVGALAVGLFVGRELRQRYKFNRRTPYDFYAHAGDEMSDMEFGVGI